MLHWALGNNQDAVVRIMLEHHFNPNLIDPVYGPPLFYANPDCAQLLLAHGADVNAHNKQGITLLMSESDLGTAQLLIDHGADVNAQDNAGQTALMWHVDRSNKTVSLLRLLLHHGARISLKDHEGHTALDYAKERGTDPDTGEVSNMEVIRLLKAAIQTNKEANPATR